MYMSVYTFPEANNMWNAVNLLCSSLFEIIFFMFSEVTTGCCDPFVQIQRAYKQ